MTSIVPFVFDDVKKLRVRNKYGALVKTYEYREKLQEWYAWLEAQRVLDAKRFPYPKVKKEVVLSWEQIYKKV